MRASRKRLRVKLGTVAMFVLAVASLAPPASASPSSFAAFDSPIAVAYAPHHILVTNYCDPHGIYSLDHQGNVSLFAPLPDQGGCVEVYLTVSPGGIPNWPANRIYANGATGTIYEITPGRVVTTFSQLPACALTHNAVTFDDQGLFGHVLLATCSTGEIYTVARDGTPTLLATIPDLIEGPDVAPLSFGTYGGDLFVTSEVTGNVYAVSPAGVVTLVATWPGAEGINFIPTNVCHFGSAGSYFRANFPTRSWPRRRPISPAWAAWASSGARPAPAQWCSTRPPA
jgi:hypothetical protein